MSTQTPFSAALLDPEMPVPQNLTDGHGERAGKRFSVYRNNVVVGLIDALESAFPAIGKSIGQTNFRAVAGVFVREHPPKSPIMMQYGAEFPEFLSQFPPLQHVKYLPDLARLEQAMRSSYHAADAAALAPDALTGMTDDELQTARFVFAPAVRIIRSPWPLYDLWRFNLEPGAPKPRSVAQSVLVTRPDYDPRLWPLTSAQAELISQLMQGAPLGALQDDPNLHEVLRVLIEGAALNSISQEA